MPVIIFTGKKDKNKDHLQFSWSMIRIQGVEDSRIQVKCLKISKNSRLRQKSYCELETQVMLSGDLDYISREIVETGMDKISEVERMLKGLIKSLEEKPLNP